MIRTIGNQKQFFSSFNQPIKERPHFVINFYVFSDILAYNFVHYRVGVSNRTLQKQKKILQTLDQANQCKQYLNISEQDFRMVINVISFKVISYITNQYHFWN